MLSAFFQPSEQQQHCARIAFMQKKNKFSREKEMRCASGFFRRRDGSFRLYFHGGEFPFFLPLWESGLRRACT